MNIMRLRAAVPVALAFVSHFTIPFARSAELIDPAKMTPAGTVDQRFQAYNIEMVEVTGGRFWRPYKDVKAGPASSNDARGAASTPGAMNPDLYEYRPPLD